MHCSTCCRRYTYPLTITQVRAPTLPVKLLLTILCKAVAFSAVVFPTKFLDQPCSEGFGGTFYISLLSFYFGLSNLGRGGRRLSKRRLWDLDFEVGICRVTRGRAVTATILAPEDFALDLLCLGHGGHDDSDRNEGEGRSEGEGKKISNMGYICIFLVDALSGSTRRVA